MSEIDMTRLPAIGRGILRALERLALGDAAGERAVWGTLAPREPFSELAAAWVRRRPAELDEAMNGELQRERAEDEQPFVGDDEAPAEPAEAPAPERLTLAAVRAEVTEAIHALGSPGSDLHAMADARVLRFRFPTGAWYAYRAAPVGPKGGLPPEKSLWTPFADGEAWPSYQVDLFAERIAAGLEAAVSPAQRNELEKRLCQTHGTALNRCACPTMVDVLVGVWKAKAAKRAPVAPLPSAPATSASAPPPGAPATQLAPAPERKVGEPVDLSAIPSRFMSSSLGPCGCSQVTEVPPSTDLCEHGAFWFRYMTGDPDAHGPKYAAIFLANARGYTTGATHDRCRLCGEPFIADGPPPIFTVRGGSPKRDGLTIYAHLACLLEHAPESFVSAGAGRPCGNCARPLGKDEPAVLLALPTGTVAVHRSVRLCAGPPSPAVAAEIEATAPVWKPADEPAGRKLKAACDRCAKEVAKGELYLVQGDKRRHAACHT